MKRLGIFLDVGNLYYCIGKKFDKRKLDYRKYLKYVEDLGETTRATAYGCQLNNEAVGFVHCLKQIGLQTKFKTVKTHKSNWDVGLSIDIVRMSERIDIVILGSSNPNLVPVVEYVTQLGVDVIVVACGISKELKDVATDFIEIPESMLEDVE